VQVLEDRTLLSVQFVPAAYATPGARPDTALTGIHGFRPVEPFLSVSNNDPGNIAVSSQGGIRVSSSDGAGGFTASTAFPLSNGGDTATAVTSDGRLFWANLANGLSIHEVDPSTGALIGSSHVIDGGSGNDKEFLAANPNPGNHDLYVVWTKFASGNHVLLKRSTDYGATWSAAVQVDSGSDGFVWPATVTVATNGMVYVAYHSVTVYNGPNPADFNGAVFVVRYNADLTGALRSTALPRGQADITFNVQDNGAPRKIPGAQFWTEGSGEPWILADPARPGNVYVIANDANNFTGSYGDIRIARSTNSGMTWTNSLIEGGPNRSEFFPNAAIDRFGDLVVAWYDNRRGLPLNAQGHFRLDVYAKYSTDGGVTFSPAFAVNDQTPGVNTQWGNVFDPDVGAVNRFPGPPPTTRIGEYFGIGIWGGTAYVAWNSNTYASFGNPNGEQVWTKAFAIRGALTVTGTTGNDTIVVRNMASNSAFVEVLVNGQRQYAGLWSALTGITIQPTTGNDTVNIENSAAGVPISINEGDGTDTVNISPTAHNLANIQGNVTVTGGPGTDTLDIFDQANSSGVTWTFAGSTITRTGSALISYGTLTNFVNVTGGSGNNTYNLTGPGATSGTTLNVGTGRDTVNLQSISIRPLTINSAGGSGADAINLGNSSLSLDGILVAVTVNAAATDTLTLNDQGSTAAHTYTVSANSITRAGGPTVTYSGVGNLLLGGSNGGDTFILQGTSASATLYVAGGSGGNTLVGSNVGNLWSVAGSDAGSLFSSVYPHGVAFFGCQNVTAGSGGDTFTFADGAALSGNLTGGGGDTLDYTAYTTSVVVDLQTGVATGVGGSVSGILNAIGGSGAPGTPGLYNLLIGSGGNYLQGGTGRRNILVAGGGAGYLVGGDGEDLLIAGSTAYDIEAALGNWQAIAAYWAGTDDFATRTVNLLSGNGVPILDPTSGTGNVFGNGGGNTLSGNGALALIFTDGFDNIAGFDPGSQQIPINP
jgi:hypothetical protein